MNEDLTRDYLEKSDFGPVQADALARLLSETATKEDLIGLEIRLQAEFTRGMAELRTELSGAMAEMRADLTRAVADTRTDLRNDMAEMESRILRWGIAMIIALASIFTLLDVFID